MPVSNFKYVVFSFSFVHLPIGCDYRISLFTSVDCFLEKRSLLSNFWLNMRDKKHLPPNRAHY